MEESFSVRLLSPEKPLANLQASSIEVFSAEGQMGLLPGHTSILAKLMPGIMKITAKENNVTYHYFVASGYLQFHKNEAKVLAETIDLAEDMDADRVHKAEQRAIARLAKSTDKDINIGRALAALERARARKKLIVLGK